jgi:hypothetical protein
MRVPSRPSFSTAPRKGLTLATLERPLCREFLFYPERSLSRSMGSGLCVAREPRLPRTHGRGCLPRPFTPVLRWALPVSSEGIVGKWYSGRVMRSVRRRLSWIIAVAFMLHLSAIMAPAVLAAAGIDIEDVCTCPTATDGATCPMHHGKTTQSQDSSNRCALKSAAAPPTLALLTLSSGVGIVPAAQALQVSVETSAISPVRTSSFASRTELPDSPPPRR